MRKAFLRSDQMHQESLFEQATHEPLASRMRPQTLDQIVGQQHLLAPNQMLRRLIDADRVPSMILWGPPGVGKTTLARVIARHTKSEFISFSAVTSGIKEIKSLWSKRSKTRLMVSERSYLSMRFIASTRHSRMHFCLTLRMVASC